MLRKTAEGPDDVLEGAEIFEVVRVDVEDYGDRRGHLEEMVLEFTSLAHQDIGTARAAVCLDEGKTSADDQGGVERRFQEDLRNHGGGGGFAVGAGDGEGTGIMPGQHPEQRRPLDDRDP